MRVKPETEAVVVMMPKGLLNRLNFFLNHEHSNGNDMSLSEYVNGAVDVCLYSDEQEMEKERGGELVEA